MGLLVYGRDGAGAVVVEAEADVAQADAAVGDTTQVGAVAVEEHIAHILDGTHPVGAVAGVDRAVAICADVADQGQVDAAGGCGLKAERAHGLATDVDAGLAHGAAGAQAGDVGGLLVVDVLVGPVGLVEVLGDGADFQAAIAVTVVDLVGIDRVDEAVAVIVLAVPVSGVDVAVAVAIHTVVAAPDLGQVVRGVRVEHELVLVAGRADGCVGVVAVGVVTGVATHLGAGLGGDGRIAVGVAVAVHVEGAGDTLVGGAVAVVVCVVAHLGGRRVGGRVGIVAVRAVGGVAGGGRAVVGGAGDVAVAVAVAVCEVRVGHTFVHTTVAVVVCVVADFRAAWVAGGVVVGAVGVVYHVAAGGRAGGCGYIRVAVAVGVGVGVPSGRVHGI